MSGRREKESARARPVQALRVGEPASALSGAAGDRPTLAGPPRPATADAKRHTTAAASRSTACHGPTEAGALREGVGSLFPQPNLNSDRPARGLTRFDSGGRPRP